MQFTDTGMLEIVLETRIGGSLVSGFMRNIILGQIRSPKYGYLLHETLYLFAFFIFLVTPIVSTQL